MQKKFGLERCKPLPIFHAVTVCDTVSAFAGKQKKTAFDAWQVYPEITHVFFCLVENPQTISEEQLQKLERFVVLLYQGTSSAVEVNAARHTMFAQGVEP